MLIAFAETIGLINHYTFNLNLNQSYESCIHEEWRYPGAAFFLRILR